MSRALVVGGSRGLGESIVSTLLNKGYDNITVVDRIEPFIRDTRINWIKMDLGENRFEILEEELQASNCVVVTAGIGRLDYFDSFDRYEIERTININTIAPIEILSMLANKLLSNEDFYVAVVTSIAGLIASPLYAVYSASKAALSRYIEAVNAELIGRGSKNRILEVAPGRIDGTGFHGQVPESHNTLMPLSEQIINAMMERKARYIPNSEIYNDVILRYEQDKEHFGVDSYKYKLKNNRLENKRKLCIGYLSGTFDLFHIGHLNLLKRAKAECDVLNVGVHESGSWKGKETFIPFDERKEIVKACRYVDNVIDAPNEDDYAWNLIHFDKLFVGSDYKGSERFIQYERTLGELGVEIVYFPYTTTTSSTQIRNKVRNIL